MHLTYRKTCRVCGSMALTKVIDIGEQHLQGSFIKPGKETPPLRKIPMQLVRCDPTKDEKACGLLQMSLTVPPEILYSAYWYRSGTNATMKNHLRGIVDSAIEFIGKKDIRVLDIGCNDGTLLKFYPEQAEKYGIDPSDIAQEIGGDIRVFQDLFPSEALKEDIGGDKFDIVTSIAMFYDLEDPVSFVRSIKEVLAQKGIWIFEMSYMPTMLKITSYDTICHEHLEYYSLAVIENILKRADMSVVKAELNEINGGSLRCYAAHSTNFHFDRREYLQEIEKLRQEEFDCKLDTDEPYKNFQERVNVHKDKLTSLLKEEKKNGKTIHIYGASTKGNTILQWCGLNNYIIDVAADRNPDKHGARTIGTDIPIVSEAESRAMRPDYYLVLPWHFKKEFLERELETMKTGTRMIFPLPEMQVIGYEDVK